MVVRGMKSSERSLATGWMEDDGTTTKYQPSMRSAGSHPRIEMYTPRHPSGVQPRVAFASGQALELPELRLTTGPWPRRSTASHSSWSALGFAALFASVLVGRVIVEAGQQHARGATAPSAAPRTPQPSAASSGSAIGTDAAVGIRRGEPALDSRLPTEERSDRAAASGSEQRADDAQADTSTAERPDAAPALPTRATRAQHERARRARNLDPHQRPTPHTRVGLSTHRTDRATPSALARLGTLRINSRPWSEVYLDGRLIGATPQMDMRVNAGRYTVRLSNPELGMSKTFTVHVTAGEVVTRVESLE